jgi:hypothetical protein
VRSLRWGARFGDHVEGRLPALLAGAGFSEVAEIDRQKMLMVPIAYLRGQKPRGDG